MQKLTRQSFKTTGTNGLPLLFDITYKPSKNKLPVVLFCHGFKGFKDWGAWPVMADYAADQGVFFIKMNFSHNGISSENLNELTDKSSFSKNTITKELDDLEILLNWLQSGENPYKDQANFDNINIIGHSRGAATVLIKAIHDGRIQKLALWAPVADFSTFIADPDGSWKKNGVKYVLNSRTGEKWPLSYDFVKNYKENEEKLDPKRNIAKLDKPLLLIHGTADETVPIETTKTIYRFVSHAILLELDDAGHTFGASHPWKEEQLPDDLLTAIDESLEFFSM